MELGLTATGMNIQPGEGLQLGGSILPDSEEFVVDLGKDSDNLLLHFNPCFFRHGDSVNAVICNSKQDAVWGEEEKVEISLPMVEKIKVIFTFRASELQVKMDDAFNKIRLEEGYLKKLEPPEVPTEFFPDLLDVGVIFPNRLGLKAIQYMSVHGDFEVKVFELL